MDEHINAPWHLGFYNQIADRLCDGNYQLDMVRYGVINICDNSGAVVSFATSLERACHIIACVNACVGSSTEDLEAHDNVLQTVRAARDTYERQRNELLTMLEEFVANTEVPERNCSCHISPPCNDCVEYGHMRQLLLEARAAIAKAEQ